MKEDSTKEQNIEKYNFIDTCKNNVLKKNIAKIQDLYQYFFNVIDKHLTFISIVSDLVSKSGRQGVFFLKNCLIIFFHFFS